MNKMAICLWYDKEAREAADFYVSVFKDDAKISRTQTLEGTPSGDTELVFMEMFGQEFQLMSAGPLFKFNESVSFVINCDTQDEIDYYWSELSARPESEQCGWLKDKFGVSWQIVPRALDEMMQTKDKEKLQRVTDAFLKMKKLNIGELEKAYKG